MRQLGITLLELLAVVMIIGVLGAVSIPSYRQYAMRAQRTEAKSALLRIATNQERFYLTNRTYSADLGALGFPSGETERGTYSIAVTAINLAADYTATATARTGAAIDMTEDAACTSFSITATGRRTATGTDAASCW